MAATVERLAACVWMCVRLCVHCGQLEPAVPPEKTALNFVENSANASQNAIFFSGATRRRPSAGPRKKKLRFRGKKCDLANGDIFLRMGGLLCGVLRRISGLRLRVWAAVGEIMLAKVPWDLGEVS